MCSCTRTEFPGPGASGRREEQGRTGQPHRSPRSNLRKTPKIHPQTPPPHSLQHPSSRTIPLQKQFTSHHSTHSAVAIQHVLDRSRNHRLARRIAATRTHGGIRKSGPHRQSTPAKSRCRHPQPGSGRQLDRRNLATRPTVLPLTLRTRQLPPANPHTRTRRLHRIPPVHHRLPTVPGQPRRPRRTVLTAIPAGHPPPPLLRILRRTPPTQQHRRSLPLPLITHSPRPPPLQHAGFALEKNNEAPFSITSTSTNSLSTSTSGLIKMQQKFP